MFLALLMLLTGNFSSFFYRELKMMNLVTLCDITYGFVPKKSTDLFVKSKFKKVGLVLHPKFCSLKIIFLLMMDSSTLNCH